jgi:hypothetical protein
MVPRNQAGEAMSKRLIKRLEELTEPSGRNAFEVATIARTLLNDAAWLDGPMKGSRDDAEHLIGVFTCKIAIPLDALLTMLEFFPQAEDWDGANLDALRWQAAGKLNERNRSRRERHRLLSPGSEAAVVISPNGPSMTEVSEEIAAVRETLSKDVKQAEVKAIELQKENSKLRSELQKARLANAQLQAEIARLREELRRVRTKSSRRGKVPA